MTFSHMSSEDAISAVNELVLAVREALLCGARATDTDATGALTEMYNRSEHATQCIDEIKQALLNSLSPAADAGTTELEEKRGQLREEAFMKNKQLKAVIDHLRCVLNAIDGWNVSAAAN